MRWMIVLLAVVSLAGSAATARAQDPMYGGSGVEITPIVGYRWGGGLSSVSGFREVDTQDNWSYGVALGKRLPGFSSVEIAYTHFQGDVEATTNGGLKLPAVTLKRDDIMLNGKWYAYHGGAFMPYIVAGLGCSIFGSDRTETVGRFAWDLGAGLRRDMSQRVGLQIQGLWMPTWVTTGTGVWCDPFYCYGVGTGEYYDQFELSAGLIIKM